jgi:glycosyltransferase involved in cell wall biosynthesis
MDQGSLGELLYSLTARVSSRRIIQSQADRSVRVATVATSVADELGKYYGVDDAAVVGNGVNPEEFTPVDARPDEQYLLYVGRLGRRKGIEDLIKAASQVLAEHEVHLKIVGKGPLREKLTEMVRDHGIGDRVDFLGHVERERLVELYQRSTVHVIPSHYEGLPTVLLEAMACGRPVVATAVSGSLDVIEDGVNGVLVPARSPEALATAVDDLLGDPARRDRLGQAARETILAEYTWEAIADEYVRLYREATEHARQPVEA